MVLSDTEIWAELSAGRLVISPDPGERVGASSVDLLLDSSLRVLPAPGDAQGVSIDPTMVAITAFLNGQPAHDLDKNGPFRMAPGRLVIGKTLERIELPTHLAGRIEGKSSLARLGLAVHITAPTIQAGFRGPLYLEMYNAGPWTLELTPRMQIAQVIFEHLGLPAQHAYRGQFQDQS